MTGVKKIWAVAVLLLFAGCSLHGGGIGHNTSTKITLGGNNFKVIASVSGMAKAKYIFGIGPSEEKLFGDAYKNMIDKSDLRYKSKTVINVTTDVKQTSLLFWSEKKVYISGEVIEFTAKAKKKLAETKIVKEISAEDKVRYEQGLADLEKARQEAKTALQAAAKAQKEQLISQEDKNKAVAKMESAIQERDKALKQRDACIADRDKALEQNDKIASKLSKLGNVKQEKRGLVVQLSDILFEFAKSRLTMDSKIKLRKIVKILQGIPDRKLLIEGHTDNRGGGKFNKLLSKNRAKSVMNFLILNGINRAKINAQGFGMERPVASNKTSAGRQKNRRVNIVILDKSPAY